MNPDTQCSARRWEPEDLSPRCKSRRTLSPGPTTSSDTTRDSVSVSTPAPRSRLYGREPPHLRSICHCRGLLTRTSSRRCFSQCGSQRRSIRLLHLHWPLNLCVLIWMIWMLCRPIIFLLYYIYITCILLSLYIPVTPIRLRRRRIACLTFGAKWCHRFQPTSLVRC